jgi:hypothetical protein
MVFGKAGYPIKGSGSGFNPGKAEIRAEAIAGIALKTSCSALTRDFGVSVMQRDGKGTQISKKEDVWNR